MEHHQTVARPPKKAVEIDQGVSYFAYDIILARDTIFGPQF